MQQSIHFVLRVLLQWGQNFATEHSCWTKILVHSTVYIHLVREELCRDSATVSYVHLAVRCVILVWGSHDLIPALPTGAHNPLVFTVVCRKRWQKIQHHFIYFLELYLTKWSDNSILICMRKTQIIRMFINSSHSVTTQQNCVHTAFPLIKQKLKIVIQHSF